MLPECVVSFRRDYSEWLARREVVMGFDDMYFSSRLVTLFADEISPDRRLPCS